MQAGVAWLVVLLPCACAPFYALDVPEDGDSSMVLFDVPSQEDPAQASAVALDLEEGSVPPHLVAIPGQSYALFYSAPLSSLGLEAGPLRFAADGELTLASPIQARRLLGRWESVLALPPAITAFRFRSRPLEACAAAGGCLVPERGAVCVVPCPPAPAPEPPRMGAYPALPVLTPCPPGWQVRQQDPLARCEPQVAPVDGCGPDHLLIPSTGCVRIGTRCPRAQDPWPDSLPSSATAVYVLEGATGRQGTRSDPLGSLAEAVALLPPGGVIALGRGTYLGDLRVPFGATLFGACPSATTVRGTLAFSGSTTVENLTLNSTVTASGQGTELVLRDVVVAGVSSLEITDGASAELLRCRLRRRPNGLKVSGAGSTATLTESVINDGIARFSAGATGRVVDSRIFGPLSWVAVQEGSVLSIERSVVEGADHPIRASSGGKLVIRDLFSRTSSTTILVSEGGLALERAQFEGSFAAAVALGQGPGDVEHTSSATISDLVISGVARDPTILCAGIDAFCRRCRLELKRAWVEDVEGIGVVASGEAHLADVVVRSSRGEDFDNIPPEGIELVHAGATVERVLVENNRGAGMSIRRCTTCSSREANQPVLRLFDARISGNGVYGIWQGKETTFEGERIELRGNGGAGWAIDEDDSHSRVSDLLIADAKETVGPCHQEQACHPIGIAVPLTPDTAMGGHFVSRFLIESPTDQPATATGLVVGGAPPLTLSDGKIKGQRIGARLLDRRFDPARLMVRVRFENNEAAVVYGP